MFYIIISFFYIVLFLLSSLYFHFRSPIRFTFTFKILFDLVLHLLFYLVSVLLYLLSFLVLFFPGNLLCQKCWVMTNSFILCPPYTYIKTGFIFLYYIFFNSCFNLLSVFSLQSIAEPMSSKHCSRCLFWPKFLLLALNLARNETWVVPRTCSLQWCVEVLSTFKKCCIINFWLF